MNKLLVILSSGSLITLGWVFGKLGLMELNAAAMILAAVIAGYPIAKRAFFALKFKVIGIDLLVSIAAIGAIIIGEYWEAAVVTFLFAFGAYLEARAITQTRNALQSLIDLTPKTASVRRDGEEIIVPAEEVRVLETVIVRSGEKLPVDGIVIRGDGYVNQASITGESMPVSKEPGSEVYSGTICETGYLEVETKRVGEDTTFARIISLVEEAQDSKAPTQRFIERFAKYYTPAVIALSIITYAITRDAKLALTLLVIACPGALVIATPISIVSGIGNGARNGILIKGGEHIERAGKVDAVFFDKTGTLTKGLPQVTNIQGLGNTSEIEVLRIANAAEEGSEHHLARAIKEAYKESGDTNPLPAMDSFLIVPGKGVIATLDGQEILVGNRRLLEDNELDTTSVSEDLEAMETKGETAVLVAAGGQIKGIIGIADTVRDEAKEVIARLRKQGIKRIVMLTGDNKRSAQHIASIVGITEVKADLLPEDKLRILDEYRKAGHTVAMVGDGINDAPAMAQADIGIAMGGIGSDVAIETADIALMEDKLDKIPYAIGLSRATLRNISINVSFAVAVVFSLLIGVLAGVVFLSSGMLIHEISVLLVILNASRLLAYKERRG